MSNGGGQQQGYGGQFAPQSYGQNYGQQNYGGFGQNYGQSYSQPSYGGRYAPQQSYQRQPFQQSRAMPYQVQTGGYDQPPQQSQVYNPGPYGLPYGNPFKSDDSMAARHAGNVLQQRMSQINQPVSQPTGVSMVPSSAPTYTPEQSTAQAPVRTGGGGMISSGVSMNGPSLYQNAPDAGATQMGGRFGNVGDPYQTPGIVPQGEQQTSQVQTPDAGATQMGGRFVGDPYQTPRIDPQGEQQTSQVQTPTGEAPPGNNYGYGTPGGYQFDTGKSSLDPGSMGGLLAFLGGNGWQQQANAYPAYYQSQYGNQAPGGPRSYWG